MRKLHCQLPTDAMVKLYYYLVYSHLTYGLLAFGRSGRTNAAKIVRMSVLTREHSNYSQTITIARILTFHSIYDYFALLKAFNTNTLNFQQCFRDKLSSHQPSHMHNTRHRTNSNFNTPLFNHLKTQNVIFHYQIRLKLYFQVSNKLKATS